MYVLCKPGRIVDSNYTTGYFRAIRVQKRQRTAHKSLEDSAVERNVFSKGTWTTTNSESFKFPMTCSCNWKDFPPHDFHDVRNKQKINPGIFRKCSISFPRLEPDWIWSSAEWLENYLKQITWFRLTRPVQLYPHSKSEYESKSYGTSESYPTRR